MRSNLFQPQLKFWLAAIFLGAVVTAGFLSFVVYDDLSRIKNNFRIQTTDIRDIVHRRINAADEITHSLATLYGASTNVDADQFRIFVEYVLDRHHYVSSVMYLPQVIHDDRPAFEESLQDYGFISFAITEKGDKNNYEKARDRQVYFPVQYHEPLSPTSSIQLGYDIYSNPKMANAISLAIDNNTAVAALPFERKSNASSYVLIKALYSGKSVPTDVSERRQNVNGLLAIHINMQDVFAGNTNNINGVNLEFIPASLPEKKAAYNLIKFNRANTYPLTITSLQENLAIKLPGQTFNLEFLQDVHWGLIKQRNILYALLSGVMLSILFMVIAARGRAISKEKQLRENEVRLRKWNDAITKLAKSKVIATGELEMGIREIVETAAENLNVARSSVWLFCDSQTCLNCVDLYELDYRTHSEGKKLCDVDHPEYFNALEQGRVIAATDAFTHPGIREFSEAYLQNLSISSILAAPFRIEGKVKGVICFEHTGPQREWIAEEQNFSAAMADMVAMAIQSNERKKVEVALREARDEALAAEKTMSNFLANMSHEIRTPLTAIIGFSESLLDSGQTMSERVDSINTIIHSGKHLLSLINDILDLSKIEASKLSIEVLPVPVFKLLNDIKLLVQNDAESKGVEFSLDYKFPLPLTINTDPVRLKQILLNLVSNAIKFTDKGSVTVRVQCFKEKQTIEFDIIDTGIGLTPEQSSKLFNPFTQADNSTTRKFGGTGLGLYLSKQLVERLDGTIAVDSVMNVGSRFTVSIATGNLKHVEFVDSTSEMIGAQDNLDEQDVLVKRFTGNILLVEDNENNQRLISFYLKKMGVTFAIANNGKEGMDEALAGDYDVVLMDMQMPVMDGLEATIKLRAQDYNRPIIALTANSLKADQERYIAAGCNSYLSKPIDKNKFYTVISEYLQPEESQPQQLEPLRSSLVGEDNEITELIDIYVQKYPEMVKKLREAFEKRDWESLKKYAHDLKGTGGNFGFREVSETAKLLEFEVCKKNETAAATYLDDLDNMHKRMCM